MKTDTADVNYPWPVVGLLVAVLLLASDSSARANDTIATASGPILNGSVYEETIGTSNDVDWWVFYTGAMTALDIALQGLGPDDCFGPYMNLTDANGELIDQSDEASSNETEHIRYTVGTGTFYVQVRPHNIGPCIGPDARYRLWISSSPGLLSAPPYIPPPPPPATTSPTPIAPSGNRGGRGGRTSEAAACQRARTWLRRIERRQRLAYRLSPRAKRRQLAALRDPLRRAKAQVRRRC